MIAPLAAALAALGVCWLVSTLSAYRTNRRLALATGLPVVCTPVNTISPLWLLCGHLAIPVLLRLPFGWGAWADDARPPWELKRRLYDKHGPVFVRATPGSLIVHVADPDMAMDIVGRRAEFPKPPFMYKMAEVYGKNLVTTDGHEYMRYRRVSGPAFSLEKTNQRVWASALEQVEQMLDALDDRVLEAPHETMQTVALHILSAAALGVDLPFRVSDLVSWAEDDSDVVFGSRPGAGCALTFGEALHTLISTLFHLMLVPAPLLRCAPVPIWRAAHTARTEFRRYMHLLTRRARENADAPANLLEALVRQSDEDGLSDDEVLSHLFIFTFAGHEPSAHALSYALVNLALHADAQEWFLRQLDAQLGAQSATPPHDWPYDVCSSLPAALCVLNETLRLYPPLHGVPKWTGGAPAALGTNSLLPAGATVIIDTIALHRDPELWGADAAQFRPQRWRAAQVRKGQFIPFSEGARACLGTKFAEVEFVAVIASLFARFRVELVRRPDEESPQARAAAWLDESLLRGSRRAGHEVPVRFIPRERSAHLQETAGR